MRNIVFIALFSLAVGLVQSSQIQALSLKVAPTEYRTTLKTGEKKKGFIDVSNPTGTTIRLKASVEGFRQTDNTGSLQFFKDEAIQNGVKLDIEEVDLGPRQVLRMYFLLDSTELPTGDVYAAIFFSTSIPQQSSVNSALRVGTTFSIINGTPGSRQAKITSVATQLFQFDDTVRGEYTVKNTGNPDSSTGFYPSVALSLSPFGEKTVQTSKLVFAGRARENEFTLKAPPIGIYRVSATYGDSSESRWVVVVRPIVALILGVLLLLAPFVRKLFRRFQRSRRGGLALK